MRPHHRAAKIPRSLRAAANPATAGTPAASRTGMALGVSTMLLLPLGALAQASSGTTLEEVKVQATKIDPNPNAEVGVPYKAKTSGDERHTRPLAETPQTISVVTKNAIDESGHTDLKQILAAQPGITLGTGENGNAFGDRYIIRGQEARSDVFVDGLRDPGITTRESFAIEQVEISKGPNSSFAGRGTAGGAVNAITKQATLDYDFTRASFALGTDKHRRVTLDANKGFTDQFALRVNALYATEDVPDRGPSERDRKGLALSGLWEVNQDLNVTLDYYGLRAKDRRPDIGSFLVGTSPYRVPAEWMGIDVPVYAQKSDFLSSDVDSFTARITYRLNPDARIVSRTRYGTADNAWVTTGAGYGPVRTAPGATPFNAIRIDGGHTGWQDVEYFAHQTNLLWNATLGGMKHEFVGGIEYTDNKATFGNYSLNGSGQNCINGNGNALNAYCVTDASGAVIPNVDSVMQRNIVRNGKSRVWQVRTVALSLMDTVDLTDRWTAFAGVRADHYKFDLNNYTAATGVSTTSYGNSDTLFNGHFGITYKINPQGMVYASVATATDINGGESDSSGVAYGGAIVAEGKLVGKPERSRLFEIGTKWNLLDDKLLFTAAAFRTNKSDVLEAPADATGYGDIGANTGGNRIQGLEFGLVGNVTEKLTMQAGLTLMKSKVTKSLSSPATLGAPLANFANRAVSVLMKYQVTDAFAIGGAANYQSSMCGGSPDQGAPRDAATGLCTLPVPSFTKYDLFASYRFNKNLDVRLNVLNVFDKTFYTAVYRSGGFLYKGDARATRLTVNYEF
ncbi:TonB-dependent receptor [Pseudorhodoferax sp.]|uniref:TonB-dependent receptor n=1 Tax=Pseudorhodoferax sp. TaxID=1993553 RepID=UPI0039E6959F